MKAVDDEFWGRKVHHNHINLGDLSHMSNAKAWKMIWQPKIIQCYHMMNND